MIQWFGEDAWYEELALGYLDWSTLALDELDRKGALSAEARQDVELVTQALLALMDESGIEIQSSGNAVAFTAEGVRHDPRWSAIRTLANGALAAFNEMGIPIPTPSDKDFNTPREDAP